jgi:hypothetical protein
MAEAETLALVRSISTRVAAVLAELVGAIHVFNGRTNT